MEELLVKLKEKLLQKECSLEALAQEFNLTELEIMGYVRMLKNSGENINIAKKIDGIYIENGSEFFEIRNNKDESLFKLSKPLDKDYFDLVVDILKAVGKNVKEIEHDQ